MSDERPDMGSATGSRHLCVAVTALCVLAMVAPCGCRPRAERDDGSTLWIDDQDLPSFSKPKGPRITRVRVVGIQYPWSALLKGPDPGGNVDLSPLAKLPLKELEIMACIGVRDLSPIRGMRLRRLWLYKSGVRDLSPLRGMPLERLEVVGGVSDLSPLRGMRLSYLDVASTDVSDVSPLRGMPLRHLDISAWGKAKITDLRPLEGMRLEHLRFKPSQVERGIEVIRAMKSLRTINDKPAEEFWREYDARRGPGAGGESPKLGK